SDAGLGGGLANPLGPTLTGSLLITELNNAENAVTGNGSVVGTSLSAGPDIPRSLDAELEPTAFAKPDDRRPAHIPDQIFADVAVNPETSGFSLASSQLLSTDQQVDSMLGR